ncbi:MAG: hypothetical protein CMJ48_06085 [Planctomycetaceae bacterium]|nr:hypothetical protein [Planctomycetaceae bacterium]
MSDAPWYQDGLRFTCTGCGNCCTGAPGVVWVSDEETQQIADLLDTTIGEIRLLHTRPFAGRVSLREFANGDCTFFDPAARCCKIYDARPVQCCTWPFWASNLESEESWHAMRESCPGAGTGDFFDVEAIEESARKLLI